MIKNLLAALVLCFVASACASDDGGNNWLGLGEPVGDVPGIVGAKPLPAGLLEHVVAMGINRDAAALAFDRYERFRPVIRNDRYISIIDFTKHSGVPRLFVIDVTTGEVDAMHVAHGSKSDPNDDGFATAFSNVPNSKKSSLGAYLVNEKYYGKYGASMRTDGLEDSNNLVRPRAIVMHPSNYVNSNRSKQGRSWGCPAVPFAWIGKLIDRLRDGSFMYAYSDAPATSAWDDWRQIQRIMLDPGYQWVNESEAAPIDGE